ncbi:MAG: sterol desaturase/sphingolipid hydroxylase (fatty acid hydroxylase superfamily) [Psychromonas sp.]|jgi:sterol desaturase/sphingolipid hydroxylase (fatty acid hydroxylase superfamily)
MWDLIIKSYTSYAAYLEKAIFSPIESGYYSFYSLIIISLLVWGLEIALPWRKNQKILRKQFGLDVFYMFFNYFAFNLLIYAALSSTTQDLFSKLMSSVGLPKEFVFDFSGISLVTQFIVFFLLYDFFQWLVHNMLHRVPILWRFHKVHHSVEEMGFAAHLRYHFMENIIYRLALYISLSYLLHFKLEYTFWLYAATTLIGHLNHANVVLDYGPLKYIFNNPKMHIWHHSKVLPESHPKGMNFGLTLSLWDYLFKTNYIPHDGRDIPLGFDKIEEYPQGFIRHQFEAFKKEKSEE